MEKVVASSSNALVSVSSSSLNARPMPMQSAKKRKRKDEEDNVSMFKATAILQSSDAKSVTFNPLRLLSRSSIPLSWLDISQHHGPIPPVFLFRATIPQFQTSPKLSESRVLVARLCPNGGLYAVERVRTDSYIACALWHWVDEERVEKTAAGHLYADELSQLLNVQTKTEQSGVVQKAKDEPLRLSKPSLKKPKNRRGVMARMSILPARNTADPESSKLPCPTATPVEAGTANLNHFGIQEGVVDLPDESTAAEVGVNPPYPLTQAPTAENSSGSAPIDGTSTNTATPFSFDTLRNQYFETLYLSKTSLAYFSKGPLARARAFVQNPGSVETSETLADFYRESILPSKKMDLKYKESISKKIESISLGDVEDANDGKRAAGRKRKAGKKPKLCKDGLYSDEDEYFHRWWQEREISNAADISMEARSQEVKSKISDLRTRETEMQMLLLLEVMGLETTQSTTMGAGVRQDSAIKPEPSKESAQAVLAQTPRKIKARCDLTSDLESLIDKLCIWHTVGIDELLASPEKTRHDEKAGFSKVKDKLRDFCADVIIPFYASRLPDRCKMICRRLGGPEVSPARPKPPMKKVSSTTQLPPGTIIKFRPQTAPKRTLERVLSEDQGMRHASPPILSRSSTAPLLSTQKREPSESSQRPASRGGMHKSVSFTNREIDLVADAKVHEAKRRKLARLAAQKQELDAAIDALKKPNRSKAARGIMEDLERRSGDSKAITGRSGRHVQITATPKRPRSKDQGRSDAATASVLVIDAPAEEAVIPSTTLRPRMAPDVPSSTQLTTKRATLETVTETPSRGLFASLLTQPSAKPAPGTPRIQRRLDFVQSTPANNRLQPDMSAEQVAATPLRMMKSQRTVLLTPLKKADFGIEYVFRDAPVIPEHAGKAMDRVMGGAGGGEGMETTIYDSLGWNDDFE